MDRSVPEATDDAEDGERPEQFRAFAVDPTGASLFEIFQNTMMGRMGGDTRGNGPRPSDYDERQEFAGMYS